MATKTSKKSAAKKPSAKARSEAAKKAAATRKRKAAQEAKADVVRGVELPVRTTGSVELSRRPQDTLENRLAEG